MNRKQRRAAHSNLQEVARRHRRLVALNPDDAKAHNELACVLLEQGEPREAAAHFARAVALAPESLEQYPSVVATLLNVNPAIRAGVSRVASAWPRQLPAHDVLGPEGLASISNDPLLLCMLETATVRDLKLERYLIAVRQLIVDMASAPSHGDNVDENVLKLCCAVAKQCFINEYVFATTSEETEKAARLREALIEALASQLTIAPLVLVAAAAYFPLFRLPQAQLLVERLWPAAVRSLLVQQVIEPEEESKLRETIPRLTPIENEVSLLVQQQYEENPYPRWVGPPGDRGPTGVRDYLRQQFPAASFREPHDERRPEILVAGCGTGQQSIVTARRFAAANVLAVDLSLASLCYAKRMSRCLGVHNVEYAQADLLALPSLKRTFDVIEASGVLHHLADPLAGWRVLLSLLRPGGFMHIGLYSKAGRGQISAARAYLAERGVHPIADEIRRWRVDILSTPMRSVADCTDYFSTSECRDLLFHVQEHQLTIPEIESFLRQHNLHFIGFELAPAVSANYRFRFPEDRAMSNLASWHIFEKENPRTFAGMYQFWIQKESI